MDQAIRVLPELIRLDRRKVRRRFGERFSAHRMAVDYLSVYRSLSKAGRVELDPSSLAIDVNVIPLPKRNGIDHHAN
jgi:hypothetical protein